MKIELETRQRWKMRLLRLERNFFEKLERCQQVRILAKNVGMTN